MFEAVGQGVGQLALALLVGEVVDLAQVPLDLLVERVGIRILPPEEGYQVAERLFEVRGCSAAADVLGQVRGARRLLAVKDQGQHQAQRQQRQAGDGDRPQEAETRMAARHDRLPDEGGCFTVIVSRKEFGALSAEWLPSARRARPCRRKEYR